MFDLLYIVATGICFAVALLYVAGCDRLKAGSTHV